jgi:DNA-directed RNA polymerase subunit E'/Rpb7
MSAIPSKVQKQHMGTKPLSTIYMKNMVTRNISLPMSKIGKNVKQILETIISSQVDGKCSVEGYIKKGSVNVLTYSNGLLKGSDIVFEVVFECLVCNPVEGMLIDVVAKNITKAGIKAETKEYPSPVVVFIARDHHYKSNYFNTIKENDEIKIRVIGQRFELNDPYISIIAELVEPREEKAKARKRPIILLD